MHFATVLQEEWAVKEITDFCRITGSFLSQISDWSQMLSVQGLHEAGQHMLIAAMLLSLIPTKRFGACWDVALFWLALKMELMLKRCPRGRGITTGRDWLGRQKAFLCCSWPEFAFIGILRNRCLYFLIRWIMWTNRTRSLNVEHQLLIVLKKILSVSSERSILNASAACKL